MLFRSYTWNILIGYNAWNMLFGLGLLFSVWPTIPAKNKLRKAKTADRMKKSKLQRLSMGLSCLPNLWRCVASAKMLTLFVKWQIKRRWRKEERRKLKSTKVSPAWLESSVRVERGKKVRLHLTEANAQMAKIHCCHCVSLLMQFMSHIMVAASATAFRCASK